ncbi:hypothetical protein SK128_009284, partial [Halocaridina rubra]
PPRALPPVSTCPETQPRHPRKSYDERTPDLHHIEQFRKEFQELNTENDAMETYFADALKGNVAVKEA